MNNDDNDNDRFIVASECEHRDYGNGGSVCVCTTSHCDHLPPLQRTPKGVLTAYSTSQTGDRFARKEYHFSEANTANTDKIRVEIDRSKKFQKILGFGGAFTDATGINIATLSSDLQDRLIRDYFDQDGLQYSMGRVPIGGSDFSPRPYTYDDNEGKEDETLSNFALQREDFLYKIPLIKRAMELSGNELKIIASPWSPPGWMKTNGQISNGTTLIGNPGGKYYKLFAQYLVR